VPKLTSEMTRKLIVFILVLIGFFRVEPSLAQPESEKDSLESLLPFANDLQRADILNGLALNLKSTDTIKARNYVVQALAISNQINYCKGKANALIIIGILQKNQEFLDIAKKYYLQGLSTALKCKDPYAVSFAYHSLGNLAYLNGDLTKAVRFYLGSVKLSEQLKDYSRAARTYNNIGTLYLDLKDIEKSEFYLLRSLELYKGSSSELIIAEISNNLANIYLAKKQYLKALHYYKTALEVFRTKSNTNDISSALNNIGSAYLAQKQAKSALPYLIESYQIDLKFANPKSLMLVLDNLGSAYMMLEEFDSAEYYINLGLNYANKFPNSPEANGIFQVASQFYSVMGENEKAAYYKDLKNKNDLVQNKQDEKQEVGKLLAEYENERRKIELKLLQKENEIKDLKLKEQENAIDRRNLLLLAAGIALFFLLLLSGLLIYTFTINKKSKLFEMSYKAKSNMLQQINHEIRTPLNGIIGMSQLALESKTFNELKDYLVHIKLSSDELMFVLNNLITYLQLERKETSIIKAPFNLIANLEDIFKTYQAKCKQKGLLFNQMVHPGLPKLIISDEQKINNILHNLLNNAVKHTEQGTVKVEVKQSATKLVQHRQMATLQFTITDEGNGLNEREIKELFTKDPEISNRSGFGIGLKNVKQLIDLMKGHLEVISEIGNGSSFIMELEVEVSEYNELINTNNPLVESNFDPGKFLILIVEDNALNQHLLVKILEKQGYNYQVAENGLEALKKIQEKTFDLVLMDIRMPEMDGIEATHHLRTDEAFMTDKFIPIIAVTAHDDAEEKQKCFDVGMNDYLTKPVNKDLLLEKIKEQLIKRSR
jgi:signal transduction histidine kinase/ActR/RegA family two-component response regulator